MDTLRLFADVARCRSFSQAARLHDITQPAASQRIGALEKHLGLKLVDRSVRPLTLTEAGRRFLDGCADVLERYDRLEREVRALKDTHSETPEPRGQVRVAAIYSSGIELLAQIHEQFAREHPRISVDIHYDKPDAVYRAVMAQERDLGIVSYPQRWRGVGVMDFREEIMAVVCRPSHALAARGETGGVVGGVEASQLSAYEMVNFDDDLPVSRRVRRYLREQGAYPVVKHTFDNIDTIKNAVAVTDRFAILPQRTVMREVASGTLAVVALHPRLVRPLGIIFRKPSRERGGSFSPAVQTFVDYLPRERAGREEMSNVEYRMANV